MGVGVRLVDAVAPHRMGQSFRHLLGSTLVANLGDGIVLAAGPLLIASLTDSPQLIALGATMQWLPPLVLGLAAGVVTDRFDRVRLVIVVNVVRCAVLAALVLGAVTGMLTVAVALVLLFLLGTAEVFADNAFATLLPAVVPRADLGIANARVMTGFVTLNQLAGPPVGAALFLAGAAWPFLAQVVLLGAATVLISRIALSPAEAPAARTGVRREIAEGVRWVWRHAAVRTLVLTVFIFNLTFGATFSLLVVYATERLAVGPVGYGLLTTMTGIGGLVGSAVYGWISRRVSLGNLMRIGLVLETCTHAAMAVTTVPAVAYAIFLVFGAHESVWATTAATIRQLAVPDALRGRVGSVNMIGVYGGLVIGSTVGGFIAQGFGVVAVLWYAFFGSAVFVVAIWRQLRHVAHAEDDVTVSSGG
ncbi:MFS transporter [Pseudonocardia sp. CA-107938]|uniref:MFS transporter n=1 Tax=Pseudonocardia sp. CA-107938 TaxID=3240021 RepID=UPI003D94B37A